MSAAGRPEISLIVGLYNQGKWLPGLLESLLAQTEPPRFEVIFCDDGSNDKPSKVLEKLLAGNELDIRYVWQPDQGFRLARSKNNGIRIAQGKAVAFVDGDTWLGPSFLRDHWEAHRTPDRLVCGRRYARVVRRLPRHYKWTEPDPGEQVRIEPLNQARWLETEWPWMALAGGNFSVENKGDVEFDEKFESWGSEDRDLAYRLYRGGRTPYALAKPNAVHHSYPKTHWTDMSHDKVVAFLENKTYFASKYPNGEVFPSLSLARRCRLTNGRWSIGAVREGVDAMAVLEEFRLWKEQNL